SGPGAFAPGYRLPPLRGSGHTVRHSLSRTATPGLVYRSSSAGGRRAVTREVRVGLAPLGPPYAYAGLGCWPNPTDVASHRGFRYPPPANPPPPTLRRQAMRVENYAHFGGKHGESAALKNLLTHAGVRNPVTGAPFTEALCFGIAGGIGAGYSFCPS